jgi:hypothetical protein
MEFDVIVVVVAVVGNHTRHPLKENFIFYCSTQNSKAMQENESQSYNSY